MIREKKRKQVYQPPQSMVEQRKRKRGESIYKVQDIEYNENSSGNAQKDDVSYALDSIDKLIDEQFIQDAFVTTLPEKNQSKGRPQSDSLDLTSLDFEKIFEEEFSQGEPLNPVQEEVSFDQDLDLRLDWETIQPEESAEAAGRTEAPKSTSANTTSDSLNKSQLLVAGVGFLMVCAVIAFIVFILKLLF